MCMFCRSLFFLLSFFFWPLCCLSFFFWPLCCLFFFFWPLCCLFFFFWPLCCQCVKMRGDYSLHWYWWNCWPSLFLTFFPINLSNNCHLGNISLFHYIWLKMRAEITINQVYLPIFFLKQPRKWPLMCLYCCTSIFPSNWFLWFLYIVELVLVLNIQ